MKAIRSKKASLEQEANSKERWAGELRKDTKRFEGYAQKAEDLTGEKFAIYVGGQEIKKRAEAGEAIIRATERFIGERKSEREANIGRISGFNVRARVSAIDELASIFVDFSADDYRDVGYSSDPIGMARRVEGAVSSLAAQVAALKSREEEQLRGAADARVALSRIEDFKDFGKLQSLKAEITQLEGEILASQSKDDAKESRFTDRPPVASLTGNELGEWHDIRQLGRKAQAWYRDNLIGKTVRNVETGWEIKFNPTGAKKIGGRKGPDLFRIVPAIEAILTHGVLVSSEPNMKNRGGVKAVHKFSASVTLAGEAKDVIATIREMDNGTYHYDLSRDMADGARFRRTSGLADAKAYGLEDNPVELNIEIAEAKINLDENLLDAVSSVMKQHGLDGKVNVAMVAGLVGELGGDIAGRYRNAEIALNPASGDVLGTLRHEIIHALRGAFTKGEWSALRRAALRNKPIRARVEKAYSDKSDDVQAEEMVAEFYRAWVTGAVTPEAAPARLLTRLREIIDALVNALAGRGFATASTVLRRIAEGQVGSRLPARGRDASGRFVSEESRFMKSLPAMPFAKNDAELDERERGIIGNLLTNAMNGTAGVNLLALVPGRALFSELGRNMPGARAYLRFKEEMDAMRNAWHAKTDEVAQAWRKIIAKDGTSNVALMELMHDATIAGVDPSMPFARRTDNLARKAREEVSRLGDSAPDWAVFLVEAEQEKARKHADLSGRFKALPEAFRAMFSTVRDTYDDLGSAFEKAILDNAAKAMKIGLQRAEIRYQQDLDAVRDDGLTGQERDDAIQVAEDRLTAAKKRAGWNKQARLAALRSKFETQRLDGPYFPLARFGNFFVTVRDEEGKVISFSRFETENQQQREAAAARKQKGVEVTIGTLSDANALRGQVDPNFVADIEEILGEVTEDKTVMDMVWQKWLETLPDLSVRRSRLHRKGTKGFDGDAFRAFGRQMFHGSHQLARLTFALDMQKSLEDGRREAAQTSDPNRAGLIINEMERRHEFTMNPTGSAWAQLASSAAFIYYLAITPAAAMVNITQTSIVGIPVLAAGIRGASVATATVALTKASRDFLGGRGHIERGNLSAEEKIAMAEAYRRGVVDKSQAHDIAGVSESGVEYSATRQRVMGAISFLFHHTERANREVTFLASYRMSRASGLDHADSINKASDLTWKTHFDYSNTSRPRLMQNDAAKVLLTFRNFTVNLLWRLFRDVHQTFSGASPEARAEARTQLVGVTAMLMLHAGIRGVWGYTLITTLLGLFFDDGKDDVEEILQSALVDTLGPQVAGMFLNGVPGHLTGINLTDRIGMPSLWFRQSDRNLEGDDVYSYWLQEMVGPVPGIVENQFRGVQQVGEGQVWRGIETMGPKWLRDLMGAYRYYSDGVTTMSGIPLIEDVSAADALKKAIGFSPARVSERYEINTRLRNAQDRILDERKAIVARIVGDVQSGQGLTDKGRAAMIEFNKANPDIPITADTIRRSIKAKASYRDEAEGGVRLDHRLDGRLRADEPDPIYN